jgi:hypothetical protein
MKKNEYVGNNYDKLMKALSILKREELERKRMKMEQVALADIVILGQDLGLPEYLN